MNDPDIINEPMALREVHAIRLFIQAETKDLSPKQRLERTQNAVLEAEKRLGIKFRRPGVSSSPPSDKAI
jgi:hypothetical protein